MYSKLDSNPVRYFFGFNVLADAVRYAFLFAFVLAFLAVFNLNTPAQGTTSGGFKGQVRDNIGKPIPGATVVLKNTNFGTQATAITDENGTYSKGSLPPGLYEITVSATGYVTKMQTQTLYAMANYVIEPDPFYLVPQGVAAMPTPNATPDPGRPPTTTPTPRPASVANNQDDAAAESGSLSMDTRRVGIFGSESVAGLPLGSSTLTRTFDELAFLIPGVNPAPQAIGSSVGPGVGGGVGTSGQFSVNGLRSRANNFTVDGSDNNDEDIGVRRQGFFTLVPQPIESIQEFQITTLLAPAEFGRNLGAQVNALSKSGSNRFNGSLFGFLNSEGLNARNTFDNSGGNQTVALQGLQGGTSPVPVFVNGTRAQVTNSAGEKDVLDLLQGGFAIGGRIVKNKVFFFASAEGQRLNGTQERHFAVPTVEQRGFAGSGATGLQQCQLDAVGNCVAGAVFRAGFPTSFGGDAVFSLFPFANDPNGIYGRNTYTQALSTDARGRILSGKIDWNIFEINQNQQILTARYNNTDDRRDLPDVGGAIFSSIRPVVRNDNFSVYLSGSLTARKSNELRFSFGRTRLDFQELRDTTGFLRPIQRRFDDPRDARFLLSANVLFNDTIPNQALCTTTSCFRPPAASYSNASPALTTENFLLGPIGQLMVAGFSSVGVDVFNFPQERTNKTYQFGDNFRWQVGRGHSLTFGTDIRRTELKSNLPRNSRPLVTFSGSPDLFDLCRAGINCGNQNTNQDPCPGRFCTGSDLASVGGATGFFQSLVLPGSNANINLGYYQLNFFAQDDWRIGRKVSLSYGLRYEYNTVPKEADNKIESTFSQTFPAQIADLKNFVNGRTKIFDSDRNNFAPRIGIAAAITPSFVVRGGFGVYYDQILGAVVSQSRNVFPTFTTVNFGGGVPGSNGELQLFNPISTTLGGNPIVAAGTLNTLNPTFVSGSAPTNAFLNTIFNFFPSISGTPFGATLPSRNLDTPFSYQYSIGVEKQVFRDAFVSVAYVGTTGRSLLRFTTPNLGSNYLLGVQQVNLNGALPIVLGGTFDPIGGARSIFAGRPTPTVGPIQQFEATGRSRYDSLQLEFRGRLKRDFRYQVNYVRGSVKDDVSDVFDLAGASALPQNRDFGGEYAPANFDVRHRFTYNFIYDAPSFSGQNTAIQTLFGGWQIASTGRFNTGQPFTVNSIFDVNLDGNLTDRLDNTTFITVTGERDSPLRLTCLTQIQCQSMLAGFGRDGAVPRNSFRAGNLLDLDISLSRRIEISERHTVQFRVDFFNFINRANFGVPVRFLEAPGFGRAVETITPGRRIQFGLKYNF